MVVDPCSAVRHLQDGDRIGGPVTIKISEGVVRQESGNSQ